MTGDQLQRDIRSWLSPPDPSTNHNIAWEAHRYGSATWFTKGSIFEEWISTGSLMWIHGKRKSSSNLLFAAADCHRVPDRAAGSGKSVLWYVIVV